MSKPCQRRHALEAFLRAQPDGDPASTTTLCVHTDSAFINLRGRQSSAEFVPAVEALLEQHLPRKANTFTRAAYNIYWLGPDEWLIEAPAQSAIELRLRDALATQFAAVNPQSGGMLKMSLHGRASRDILAKGCTLDLDPRVFAVGACAQSGLAKAGVLIALTDDRPQFSIIVRRSFADYVARWLADAGREFGLNCVLDKNRGNIPAQ